MLRNRGLGEGQLADDVATGRAGALAGEEPHDGDPGRVPERLAETAELEPSVETQAGTPSGSHATIRPASADAATVKGDAR